jgi:hypothetical protein
MQAQGMMQKASIDLRFNVEINPSTINEPIINSPIRTA